MKAMPGNPSKVLAVLQNEAQLAGVRLTMRQIAELGQISEGSLRTEMSKYFLKYPEEFAFVHREKENREWVYWYSETMPDKPKSKPKKNLLADATLARIIDVEGEAVVLKDEKGRVIVGRYVT